MAARSMRSSAASACCRCRAPRSARSCVRPSRCLVPKAASCSSPTARPARSHARSSPNSVWSRIAPAWPGATYLQPASTCSRALCSSAQLDAASRLSAAARSLSSQAAIGLRSAWIRRPGRSLPHLAGVVGAAHGQPETTAPILRTDDEGDVEQDKGRILRAQITRNVIALSTARVRSRVPSLSRIVET